MRAPFDLESAPIDGQTTIARRPGTHSIYPFHLVRRGAAFNRRRRDKMTKPPPAGGPATVS